MSVTKLNILNTHKPGAGSLAKAQRGKDNVFGSFRDAAWISPLRLRAASHRPENAETDTVKTSDGGGWNMRCLNMLIICLLTAITCSAAKYQIKVLNTPTITIDKKEAKVGDWFDDQSVIEWSRDNQAMRVVSDANKVYTLSAKLYKEANAKKFADFIAYTKPLASRGVHDATLIEQLQDRFDGHFVMLDEIVIDLSDLDLPEGCYFYFSTEDADGSIVNEFIPEMQEGNLTITREDLTKNSNVDSERLTYAVGLYDSDGHSIISEIIQIELLQLDNI